MAKKTTIKIEALKGKVNSYLARKEVSQEAKIGLCTLIENVLMDSGSYLGFTSLTWKNGGFVKWCEDGNPDFPEKQKYMDPEYDRLYY